MRRLVRSCCLLLVIGVAIWLLDAGWRVYRLRSLAAECETYERAGSWTRLMRSAREWMRLAPESREARQAGAKAGRALRDVSAVQEFLEGFPRGLPDDVPWLSMLADLEFGPLNRPQKGAQVCREILEIVPDHKESHQRLVFFYAMTQQQMAMQSQVEMVIDSQSALPEACAYGFLGSGLRLRNGSEVTQRWLLGDRSSELLNVALALHISTSLSGAVPSVDEASSENIRMQQRDRDIALAKLREKYPRNTELLAYLLMDAVQYGMALQAAEILQELPAEADQDFRFWHVRGWIFTHVQDFDEAHRCYMRALTLNPLDWRTRFHFGELQRLRGDVVGSTTTNRLAVLGRSLEKDLLEVKDMRSIPIEVYQRLADYSRQCGADRMSDFINRFSGMAKTGLLHKAQNSVGPSQAQ